MTTKRLADIEKLLSSVITFKPLAGTSRTGLVGKTAVNLCELPHDFLKKTEQAYVQIACGEMLTVYDSCKVEIEKNRIIFSSRGQRTVVWTGERK